MKMKRFLSSLTVLVFALCLLSSTAFAAPTPTPTPGVDPTPTANPAPTATPIPAAVIEPGTALVINPEGETLYNDGDTVFNNFGTVYNNGGVVFNNGGTVYNNSGTVYNNGGVVYNNGALVYNNIGTVYNNGQAAPTEGEAEPTEGDAVPAMAESEDDGLYELSFAADYSALCDIDGLTERDGKSYIEPDGAAVITAKPGLELVSASTDTGACTIDSEGAVTLDRVDRDGTLTLGFTVAAPVISPEGGSYAEEHTVTISCEAEGAVIRYTTDGSEPDGKSAVYDKPFEIEDSCVVRAVAMLDGAEHSEIVEVTYIYPDAEDVDFGRESEGYRDVDEKAVVVRNTGLGSLVIESAELAGADKDSFTLSSEKGATIASGQSNSRSWKVEPVKGLAAGEYEAEVVFTLASGDTFKADVEFEVVKADAKRA